MVCDLYLNKVIMKNKKPTPTKRSPWLLYRENKRKDPWREVEAGDQLRSNCSRQGNRQTVIHTGAEWGEAVLRKGGTMGFSLGVNGL